MRRMSWAGNAPAELDRCHTLAGLTTQTFLPLRLVTLQRSIRSETIAPSPLRSVAAAEVPVPIKTERSMQRFIEWSSSGHRVTAPRGRHISATSPHFSDGSAGRPAHPAHRETVTRPRRNGVSAAPSWRTLSASPCIAATRAGLRHLPGGAWTRSRDVTASR